MNLEIVPSMACLASLEKNGQSEIVIVRADTDPGALFNILKLGVGLVGI